MLYFFIFVRINYLLMEVVFLVRFDCVNISVSIYYVTTDERHKKCAKYAYLLSLRETDVSISIILYSKGRVGAVLLNLLYRMEAGDISYLAPSQAKNASNSVVTAPTILK